MTETAGTDIGIETPPPPVMEKQDAFFANVSKIYQRLKQSQKLKTPMKEVEQDMLGLLDVKLSKVQQSVDNGKEILASFKGGDPDDDDSIEIRVPFNATLLAGYVAFSQRALVIKNFLNSAELIACKVFALTEAYKWNLRIPSNTLQGFQRPSSAQGNLRKTIPQQPEVPFLGQRRRGDWCEILLMRMLRLLLITRGKPKSRFYVNLSTLLYV